MYKCPIEKIYGELQTQMVQEDENMVMKAIRKVGVNVDKEELIKALQYDRNQYTKGYDDGKNDVLEKLRADIEEHAKINQNLNTDRARALCWCLDVIDKHKTESRDV